MSTALLSMMVKSRSTTSRVRMERETKVYRLRDEMSTRSTSCCQRRLELRLGTKSHHQPKARARSGCQAWFQQCSLLIRMPYLHQHAHSAVAVTKSSPFEAHAQDFVKTVETVEDFDRFSVGNSVDTSSRHMGSCQWPSYHGHKQGQGRC